MKTIGASQSDIDEIGSIINRAIQAARRDPATFETVANRGLKPYGIIFTRTSPVLVNSGAPAAYDNDTVLVRTPELDRGVDVASLLVMISHELVHRGQVEAADRAGGKEAMLNQSLNMVGQGGRIEWKAYQQDPHETTAYARTAIDLLRYRGLNRDQMLADLRKGRTPLDRPADRKRFLKKAYGYATQERACAIVNNLLEGADDPPIDAKQFITQKLSDRIKATWVFFTAELDHPERANAHDEFIAEPVYDEEDIERLGREMGVMVTRDGTVLDKWADGTTGVPPDIQQMADMMSDFHQNLVTYRADGIMFSPTIAVNL